MSNNPSPYGSIRQAISNVTAGRARKRTARISPEPVTTNTQFAVEEHASWNDQTQEFQTVEDCTHYLLGCGCCVAACKNGSAMLFVSSKVSQLALLPQGRPEAAKRAKAMIAKMEELGFGNCTNTRACEAECPKNESIANIARLNREFIKAKLAD